MVSGATAQRGWLARLCPRMMRPAWIRFCSASRPSFCAADGGVWVCAMVSLLERLRDAMNAHDPDRMASLVAADYDSRQPVHPARASAAASRCWPTGQQCSRASLTSSRN